MTVTDGEACRIWQHLLCLSSLKLHFPVTYLYTSEVWLHQENEEQASLLSFAFSQPFLQISNCVIAVIEPSSCTLYKLGPFHAASNRAKHLYSEVVFTGCSLA